MDPVLDSSEVLRRFEGDLVLLREVSRLFLESSAQWLSELRAALTAQDWRTLKRVAHTLKGSVSNFLARAAGQAAFQVEKAAESGDPAQAAQALAALELEIHRLQESLASLGAESLPE